MPLQRYGAKDVTGMQSNIASTFQTFVPCHPCPCSKVKAILGVILLSKTLAYSKRHEWQLTHSEWIIILNESEHASFPRFFQAQAHQNNDTTGCEGNELAPHCALTWRTSTLCMNMNMYESWLGASARIANQGFLMISCCNLFPYFASNSTGLATSTFKTCVAFDTPWSMFCFQLWAPNVGPETWDIVKHMLLKGSRFAWGWWGVLRWYNNNITTIKSGKFTRHPLSHAPSFQRPPPAPDCPSHPWSHTETTNCRRPTLP